ncbi:transketolase, C-terminal subunit [Thermoclostridium stercorarium subsp. stercorarium DSM 8532]|jgi:transketolase|uniref:Transketolase, C-terminal subunit n=3 Tax=Thermoclostridium stercorarium TaxID=1510 RepID=L7VM07_THES1|nr:transketolase family protein [Thermoclostridium stercorarium]AGC69240.1 transketolase, C-terminal subunit [Thermoclostridium stercorarium subsp. stercorarium DSM 8532]AGI40210.1 TrkB [Thermoclostridium stercorarium subsp. stercorarium DSM 8532]ANW99514.1 transketolase [Thermoclostridium stercorarium subsp. thermolacticum DSM 2910]ANX02141.1 transketolase [Thermoclostridium stercorarium subsp. leptospartum DSM 9219]UZQ85211.1 transketolase family protein [Thermoclostridium stercorarium]
MANIATRQAYGEALAEFGADERIVVLDADLSKSTKTDLFKKKYPERHFNMGIAEAGMMCTAAGLASCGKIVFASSFAVFAAGRAFEMIRNSICYPNFNVKIGATHAGISVGEDGASHQAIEDIALMRSLPNMSIISPCDAVSTRFAVKAAIEKEGPVYLRFGRLAVPQIYDENATFEFGKGVLLRDGTDVTIIANGLMVQYALEAAKILEEQDISARVIDIHTIKPIDRDIILKAAKETGCIVTAEEHSVVGGLGSAVAEVVCSEYPVPVKMVGIQDQFGKSGNPYELLKMYGLTAENIAAKAIEAMQML